MEADTTPCCGIADLLSPRFFKALCDANRLAILARLAEAGTAQSVGQIASCCETDLSVVSRHLAALRDAGILTSERRGKEVYYSVCIQEVAGILRRIADALEACCPPDHRKEYPHESS